jgi:hypothetical protein
MKIAINRYYGGFGFTDAEYKALLRKKGIRQSDFDFDQFMEQSIKRNDPDLIEIVESVADPKSTIKIVEIPDDVNWIVQDYDGLEWVAEKHRTWE